MTQKLVDPIRFYDALGNSVHNIPHLHKRIGDLERENEQLKAMVYKLKLRLQFIAEQDTADD